jgi:RHS repeat-associated protein
MDNEDILLELDGSNNITARYTHGPGIDEPLILEKGGASFFYHVDGLGSITEITDINGNVIQRYTYSSFGKIESQLDPNFVQPYTFTAREFDSETSLYYYRARYYAATVGRFLQQDPFAGFVRTPESLNRYPYALNNPQSFVDPDAELPTLADLIGGAIVGGGAGIISGAASGSKGGLTGAILGGALGGATGIFTGTIGAAVTNVTGGGVAGAVTGELVGNFIGELLSPSPLGRGNIPVIRNAPPFDQKIRGPRPPRLRKPIPELKQLKPTLEPSELQMCPIPG